MQQELIRTEPSPKGGHQRIAWLQAVGLRASVLKQIKWWRKTYFRNHEALHRMTRVFPQAGQLLRQRRRAPLHLLPRMHNKGLNLGKGNIPAPAGLFQNSRNFRFDESGNRAGKSNLHAAVLKVPPHNIIGIGKKLMIRIDNYRPG